jgi:glycosyltransferase involved in cell wall biosynthesis
MGVPPALASVSVVIPAFNAAQFLEEALISVETIVVDDGSTDRTARRAEALGARVISQTRQGAAAARNTGVRAARGTWIAFLDADDVWDQGKVASQLDALGAFPDARMVSCDRRTVDLATEAVVEDSHLRSLGSLYAVLRSERLGQWRYFAPGADGLLESGFVPLPSTTLFNREALHAVGLFNEALLAVEDYEFFTRFVLRFPIIIDERVLVEYKLHGRNIHLDVRFMETYIARYRELVEESPTMYSAGALRALAIGSSPYAIYGSHGSRDGPIAFLPTTPSDSHGQPSGACVSC